MRKIRYTLKRVAGIKRLRSIGTLIAYLDGFPALEFKEGSQIIRSRDMYKSPSNPADLRFTESKYLDDLLFVFDDDSMDQLGAWFDDELESLETRFRRFSTRRSIMNSLSGWDSRS